VRVLRFLPLALAVATLTGCGEIASFFEPRRTVVDFEVWNRTLDDVWLQDGEGRMITVPACGHADAAPLAVADIELRMDAGLISSFAIVGKPGPLQYMVVVADGEFDPGNDPPAVLPPCAGHPNVMP
jgi:hypothetical protein